MSEQKEVQYVARHWNLRLNMVSAYTKEVKGRMIPVPGRYIQFEQGVYKTSDPEEIEYIEGLKMFGTEIIKTDVGDVIKRKSLEEKEKELAEREAKLAEKEGRLGKEDGADTDEKTQIEIEDRRKELEGMSAEEIKKLFEENELGEYKNKKDAIEAIIELEYSDEEENANEEGGETPKFD